MPDRFRVEVTDTAKRMLRRIAKRYGKKTYQTLRDLIMDLADAPATKGEPLRPPLHGLYSRHYSRFRVLYDVNGRRARVLVVAAGYHASGERQDVYRVVLRMVERGELVIRGKDDVGPSEGDTDERKLPDA